ncbi:PAS sensor domain-containing protein [Halarcobacter mediterraneus]|uniref:PAS sensor domain-containing protein n=1 Tax=Halarcobacter mediterraneus TaxID=2023153 RepID=A0A4Q1ASJ0_9BACT|nr:PAS domain-containing protein [Halarcobacter mediterraneus]RXK12643.1 PAS sensor domain-containing protein [Halarcobacter mediterraneus]
MNEELILDKYAFLVSETDEKGIITFANDDFCRVAGYTLKELLNQPHSIVRHKDMPKAAFKDLWATVKRGEVWTGYVKNKTKSQKYYWVFATVYPTTNENGEISYMSCRRKASKEEIEEYSSLYKKMLLEE